MKADFKKADLFLLTVVLIWGMNIGLMKSALKEFHPLSFVFLRFSMASLLMMLILRFAEGRISFRRADLAGLILLGVLGIGVDQVFFIHGLYYTSASNTALLFSASPIFTVILSALLRLEKVDYKAALGVLISFLGIYVIIKGDLAKQGSEFTFLKGDLFILTTAMSWAIYTIYAKNKLMIYSFLKVTAYSMVFGTLFILPFAIKPLMGQDWSVISGAGWFYLFYAAVFSAVIGYTLWSVGIVSIGPNKTMLYQYLVPVIAVIFAVIYLHEAITLYQIIGGSIVLSGIYLARIA